MKKILAIPYSIYVGLLFFLCLCCMLLLYIPLLVIRNDRTRMKIIYVFNDLFLRRIWSNLSGIWVSVEGREKIDAQKTYVFTANHSNIIDIAFMGSCINHYYKPLVKKELLSTPVLGQLLSMTSLSVDRKNAESRKRTAQEMVESLKKGLSLMIFPEGTRNRTPEPVKDFYDGAFKSAIAAQVNIAPIVLLNVRHLQPVGSAWFYPGKAIVRFLDPIDTKGMTMADTEELKENVRNQIKTVLLNEDILFKNHPK